MDGRVRLGSKSSSHAWCTRPKEVSKRTGGCSREVGFKMENFRVGEESPQYPLVHVCSLIPALVHKFLVVLKVMVEHTGVGEAMGKGHFGSDRSDLGMGPAAHHSPLHALDKLHSLPTFSIRFLSPYQY